ncbi:MAG: response regulator [Candidatus Zipacnadales bacterium]
MPARVLVVETDPEVRDLIVTALREHGYDPFPVATGAQCLAVARSRKPDVICIEASLADVDGFEVVRRLLHDPETSRIPVVFVTSRASLEERVEGLRLGAHAYLTKPFSFPELFAILEGLQHRTRQFVNRPATMAPPTGMGLMGSLGAISIASVIQAIEAEKQTGVLRVVSGTRWGQLAFHNGKIVAAVSATHTGEQTIFDIVSWETGMYTFRSEPVEPTVPLAESATGILMRALQHHDEEQPYCEHIANDSSEEARREDDILVR